MTDYCTEYITLIVCLMFLIKYLILTLQMVSKLAYILYLKVTQVSSIQITCKMAGCAIFSCLNNVIKTKAIPWRKKINNLSKYTLNS